MYITTNKLHVLFTKLYIFNQIVYIFSIYMYDHLLNKNIYFEKFQTRF